MLSTPMQLAADNRYGWIVLSYCLCIFFIVAFAIYGILWTIFRGRKEMERIQAAATSAEAFISAKGSQGPWRIGWSFFCAAVGGWVISSPANFVTWGGWIIHITYPLSTGIPILIISFGGTAIMKKYPNCCSLGDFIAWRFGPTAKLYVACVTLLNMGIFLLVEMTLIGALFESYVGDKSYPIIIVQGVVTTIYTAYGGLLISIITDQAQAVLSIIILLIISIYLAVEFRQPLDNSIITPEYLGANFYGYSSILTLPVGLIAATCFSEQCWQRVWASESERTVKLGGIIGFISVTIFVFLCGFYGYLAAWAGLIDFDNTNVNVYMFQVFKKSPSEGGYQVSSWITMIVLILATIMNESAIDSILNGITATLSSQFFRGKNINICRVITTLIMVPIIVLATYQYNTNNAFLLSNILCSCGFIPTYLGLIDHPIMHSLLSETCLLFSFSLAIITVTFYGVGVSGNDVALGANMAWWLNSYAWDYFAVSTFSSVGYMLLFMLGKQILLFCGIKGIGISDITMKIPGFKYLAGHWEEDLGDIRGVADPETKVEEGGFEPVVSASYVQPAWYPMYVPALDAGSPPGSPQGKPLNSANGSASYPIVPVGLQNTAPVFQYGVPLQIATSGQMNAAQLMGNPSQPMAGSPPPFGGYVQQPFVPAPQFHPPNGLPSQHSDLGSLNQPVTLDRFDREYGSVGYG